MIQDEELRRQQHSGDYVRDYATKPFSRLQRLLPLMQLRADDRVVDLGCANGMLAALVHDSVAQYVGVDFSDDFIKVARANAAARGMSTATFHCQDIVSFCREHPQAFTVATAMDFSEHLYDNEFVEIFTAVRGALAPGGRLFLHTPNMDFFYEWMKAAGLAPQFPQHIGVRNAARNVQLLEQCGFARRHIEVTDLPHYNILKLVHPLRRLPGAGRWFRARLFIRCVNTQTDRLAYSN